VGLLSRVVGEGQHDNLAGYILSLNILNLKHFVVPYSALPAA
jgi:hypothetical protein